MKKWLKRMGIGLLILILVVCAITYFRFTQWRDEVTKNLLGAEMTSHARMRPMTAVPNSTLHLAPCQALRLILL